MTVYLPKELPFVELLEEYVRGFEEKSKGEKDKDVFFIDFFVEFLKQYKDLHSSKVIGLFLSEAPVVDEKAVTLLQYLTYRDLPKSLYFILNTKFMLAGTSKYDSDYTDNFRFLLDCALDYSSIQCICLLLMDMNFCPSESQLQKVQHVKFSKRGKKSRRMLREAMNLSIAVFKYHKDLNSILREIECVELRITREILNCAELLKTQADLYEKGAICESNAARTAEKLAVQRSLLLLSVDLLR